MKRYLIWLVLVAIVVFGIFYLISAKNKPLQVEVTEVKRGEINQNIRLSGETQADGENRYFAPVTSKVTLLPIADGGQVEKGSIIIDFEKGNFQVAVSQAKAALETALSTKQSLTDTAPTGLQFDAARANVDAKRILLDQARADFEKTDNETNRDLYQAAVVAHKNALFALESLEKTTPNSQAVQSADQQISSARKTLAEAEKQLRTSTLIANQKGTLIYLASAVTGKVGLGQTVAAGTELFQIINSDNIYFAAEADEEDLGLLTPGRQAALTLNAFPDLETKATVSLVENQITTTGDGAEVIIARLKLLDPQFGPRLGLNGEVIFNLESKKDVLVIPIEAVIEDNGEDIVYIVEADKARKAVLETGIEDGNFIEVKSGLSEGSRIIIGDKLKDVQDKKPVKVKD